MSKEPKQEGAGRGLSEVSQSAIEDRALEIAKSKGREEMDENDIETARTEILGKSTNTAAPEGGQKAQG